MPLLVVALMILITTARHEGSHAVAAWLAGVPVHEVRLLPGVHPERGFYFGYVARGDGGGWLVDAAPFLIAMLWFAAALTLIKKLPGRSPLWFPVFLIGLVSPLADLAYNYQGGLWREGTDVWDLFAALPNGFVHVYFLASIALCAFGLRSVLRLSREPGARSTAAGAPRRGVARGSRVTGSDRFPYEPLATSRLDLREPHPDHAPLLFEAISSDAAVTRFLRWRPQEHEDEARASMGRRLEKLRNGSELSWVIFRRTTESVVGVISLWPSPPEAEIGFALARSAWGEGFATEAARSVIDWAFRRLSLDRIWASCDVDNVASRRVLEKLGLEQERVAEAFVVHPNVDSRPRDCFIYAIERTRSRDP